MLIGKDPFGHIWSIATHIKDLTKEELKRQQKHFQKCQNRYNFLFNEPSIYK